MHRPFAPLPGIAAADMWSGLYRAALPQLPVTLLNAVVSTAKLTEDLYPERPASVLDLGLGLGLANPNPDPNPNPNPNPHQGSAPTR